MNDHDHDHDHDHDDEHDHDHEEEAADRDELVAAEMARRMAFAQIRRYGDPVLRMRANEVTDFDDELARLGERMTSLMHAADGIGLAATQVGIVKRLFVFNDDGEDQVLVNPSITRRGDEVEVDGEGCLSLPGVHVPVERALDVTIEARDVAGEPIALELEGVSARVVQHELDHLDGKLMIDRTDAESRREALRELRPRLAL